MRLILLSIYPSETMARYLLSSYILKAYLYSYFKSDKGLSIEVLNFSNTSDISTICETIIESNPDYVGYSCYIWNIEKILKIIKQVRKKSKPILHILGGPEISLKRILSFQNSSPDSYYVIGEGERKLLLLLSYFDEKYNDSAEEFPRGVAHWKEGSLYYRASGDSITNLDEIPSVYISGAIGDSLYARQQAFMETQRGCKLRCKYCVYHKNLQSIDYYSLERVFAELEHLIVKKQVKALRIFDAIFTSDIQRAKSIIRYLQQLKSSTNIRLPFIYWELTCRHIDEEFMKLTADLKYRESICNSEEIAPRNRPQLYTEMLKDYTAINCVGIQSFCKEALKAVGRPLITAAKFKSFMNNVKRYNIVLKLDLILGLPFETYESYFEGIELILPFLKSTDHILNIHRQQILPGSDMETLCDTYGIRYSLEAPHIVFSTQCLSEDELNHASKLTAVLLRVLNSPLRHIFFSAEENAEGGLLGLLEDLWYKINTQGEFAQTGLIRNELVDDEYWNDGIFREIPSEWLIEFFEGHGMRKKYVRLQH